MKSSEKHNYYLIFDTNILFQQYNQKADFTKFSFNSTFKNVVDMINKLDIYEKVIILIPAVVWQEMEKQIIEAHDNKIVEVKQKMSKYKFPEVNLIESKDKAEYEEYISEKISNYKIEISSGINTVIELPFPSNNRFSSIVQRAFNKHPPFGGKDKQSDKGFKDVLLWESILEFADSNEKSSYILYSKDKMFNKEELCDEFEIKFKEASINICSDETKLKQVLEEWSEEIDEYAFLPLSDNITYENQELEEWIESVDFIERLSEFTLDFIEENYLIRASKFQVKNILSIEEDESDREDMFQAYLVNMIIEIVYRVNDALEIREDVDVMVSISQLYDETFFLIEDVYKAEE